MTSSSSQSTPGLDLRLQAANSVVSTIRCGLSDAFTTLAQRSKGPRGRGARWRDHLVPPGIPRRERRQRVPEAAGLMLVSFWNPLEDSLTRDAGPVRSRRRAGHEDAKSRLMGWLVEMGQAGVSTREPLFASVTAPKAPPEGSAAPSDAPPPAAKTADTKKDTKKKEKKGGKEPGKRWWHRRKKPTAVVPEDLAPIAPLQDPVGFPKSLEDLDEGLTKLFERMDTNGDGMLSFREAEAFAMSIGLPRIMWQDTLDNMAGNGAWLFPDRGVINLQKFKHDMKEKELFIKSAFQVMDKNGDGRINMKELEEGLRALEIKGNRYMPKRQISEHGLKLIMMSLDRGRPLDFDHFRDLFVLLPLEDIQNITPYYMKVALDLGHELEFPDKAKGGSPFGHLISGGLAGGVAKTVTSPLSVLLARVQASTAAVKPSIAQTARNLYRDGGPRAFYQGNLANVMRGAPSKAVDFCVYNFLKDQLTNGVGLPSDGQRLIAGGVAGLCSTSLFYPLEVITNRMAVAPAGLYKGVGDCIMKIVQKDGVRALYRGIGPALVGVAPYSALQFASYDVFKEALKSLTKQKELNVPQMMVCGMMAGWVGLTASYPCDLVGMRLQTQGLPGKPILYKNMIDAIIKIWKAQGPLAFYTGWSLASMKVIPAAAASMTTYELTKRAIQWKMQQNTEILVPMEEK